ncbi:hypothetical protein H0A66_16920 [Alcaligenaceae bacterium]|nr:hypothetical protein [Alcaligenaceae bacterium]
MNLSKFRSAIEKNDSQTDLICPSCHRLPLGTGGTLPHFDMQLQDQQHPASLDGAFEKQYLCKTCHTVWLKRIDKWGIDNGFRLKP